MSEMRRILVLGGARSGKSRYAQGLLGTSQRQQVMIATAEAGDGERAARIAAHRAERPAGWITVECPLDLAPCLTAQAAPDRVLLVDCLTLWLSNLFMAERNIEAQSLILLQALASLQGPVVLVSNEVGGGIVPESALGRAFRDAQGRLNQQVAQACDRVVLVSAGLPLQLKPAPLPAISV